MEAEARGAVTSMRWRNRRKVAQELAGVPP